MVIVEHERGNWNVSWTPKPGRNVGVANRGSGELRAGTSVSPTGPSVALWTISLTNVAHWWTSAKVPLLNSATTKAKSNTREDSVSSRRSKSTWTRPPARVGSNVEEIAPGADRTKMIAWVPLDLSDTTVDVLNSAVSSPAVPRWNKYRKAGPVVRVWESRVDTPDPLAGSPEIENKYTSRSLYSPPIETGSHMKSKVSPIEEHAVVASGANGDDSAASGESVDLLSPGTNTIPVAYIVNLTTGTVESAKNSPVDLRYNTYTKNNTDRTCDPDIDSREWRVHWIYRTRNDTYRLVSTRVLRDTTKYPTSPRGSYLTARGVSAPPPLGVDKSLAPNMGNTAPCSLAKTVTGKKTPAKSNYPFRPNSPPPKSADSSPRVAHLYDSRRSQKPHSPTKLSKERWTPRKSRPYTYLFQTNDPYPKG